MSEEEVKADLRGRLEAAVTSEAATVTPDNRRNNRRNLRDIWAQFVTCLRPDPESAVADPGGHGDDRTADKRDVKKSVWSYRPYDVF